MKKILSYIINLFKRMTFKDFIMVILIGIIICLFCSNRYYQNETRYTKVIYNDSIFSYKNKLKEIYTANNLYIQDIDELKKQNNDLSKEIKSLKDNPIVIIKTVTETKIDSMILRDTVVIYKDSVKIQWSYDKSFSKNNSILMLGETNYNLITHLSQTELLKFRLAADLYLDIIEKNKQLMIIAKSNNPYLTFVDIQGAMLSPNNSKVLKQYFKPKRWHLGLYAGYGATVYDSKVVLGLQVGVGLSWSILSF